MKKLVLYGLIFSVLLNIFQYMYSTKKFNFDENRAEKFKLKMTDSISKIVAQKEEGDYFSLAYDEKAQDYLEGYDVQKLMPQVKEKLMDMNSNPTGNKLIPYDNMVINKVRFLNHRWIIADFTGDSNWGEVILKYFLEKDGSVTFETAETVMYPQQ
ncbi:hypothetical protein SL053_001736 [Flavobacterium psychrophilum]|uniref:Hydrolase n=4 Tax=Flavobacterium psychrophilum TaxID=96345 RepID=A6GYL2_FLAPJ|nr:hypothetical protein [Flavobacterium psychrophilum]AIG29900.1 hypothetical protein IA03_05200 [Flavobacterium psychrophilum]AIG32177.1 hypothetical protein IA01_05205 [Flavobacterium psychrophilum]AIG34333.1 hypothetical protein IA02_04620 [Flavobacterium psychrophilum]AIG36696.1 hypothetical protein IA04_05110 [Flavobacterium psychrophilum]AIG38960.1 hypothetical protein IA05_05200 [Flavobacterium psychrophilum]